MNWQKEKNSWPNAHLSQFVNSFPHFWHVQDTDIEMKNKRKGHPTLLLLHGAGASTHSWRLLMERLYPEFRIILIDLPGHGFTKLGSKNRSSLDLITQDLSCLLKKLEINPSLVIGHSAGAAIAMNLTLKKDIHTKGAVCLNGALENFSGLAGVLYPFMAKLLSLSPFTVPLFTSIYSSFTQVEKFLRVTGSKLTPEGIRLYQRLITSRSHVEGTLAMMSQWDLKNLTSKFSMIPVPACFILGEKDFVVKNSASVIASEEIHDSEVIINKDHGHLMHEQDPDLIANQIKSYYYRLKPI